MGLNHIYKVIWSKTKNAWVVVSEIAKRDGKSSVKSVVASFIKQKSLISSLAVFLILPLAAQASPLKNYEAGEDNVYWGTGAASNGHNTVVGSSNRYNGEENVLIGTSNMDNTPESGGRAGQRDVLIGYGNSTQSKYVSLVGSSNDIRSNASQSIAIGKDNRIEDNAVMGIAIGNNVSVQGERGIAVGRTVTVRKFSIAIGDEAKGYGVGSLALGYSSQASSESSIAIGGGSYVGSSAERAVAINGRAEGQYSLGVFGTAAGNRDIVIGQSGTRAGGERNIVIGDNNTVYTGNNTVIGNNITVDASGKYNGIIVLGDRSNAKPYTAPTDTSINGINIQTSKYQLGLNPSNAQEVARGVMAIGNRQIKDVAAGVISATSTDAINGSQLYEAVRAVTVGANPDVYIHVNDGTTTQGAGNSSTNLGKANEKGGATGKNSIAIGTSTHSTDESTIAIGQNTAASDKNAVAIGKSAQASDSSTVAIGDSVNAGSDNSIAIGKSSSANGVGALTIGTSNSANGYYSVVLGNSSYAYGESAIAIGKGAGATGNKAIAIGENSKAVRDRSISIGTGNEVNAEKSSAIGDPSYIAVAATGTHVQGNDNGTAMNPIQASESTFMGNTNLAHTPGTTGIHVVGNNNSVDSSNVMVMGNNVSVGIGLDGAVVLGNDSSTNSYSTPNNTTISGLTLDASKFYGTTTNGSTLTNGSIVSIGDANKERQIKNVAAGVISATSTDAINGSQLYEAVRAVTAGASPDVYMHVNDGTSTQGAGNASTNLGKANEKGGATGNAAIAIGGRAQASGENSISMGHSVKNNSADSVAIGFDSSYITPLIGNNSQDSVAIGFNSYIKDNSSNSVALGSNIVVQGTRAVAIGDSTVNGDSSIAINSKVGNKFSNTPEFVSTNSVGINAVVKGDNNIAIGGSIGFSAESNTSGVTSLSGFTKPTTNSIGIGYGNLVTQSNTVMVGSHDLLYRKSSNKNNVITPSEHKLYHNSGTIDTNYYEGTLSNSIYLGHESYAFTPDALVDDESHLTGEQSIHTKKYDSTGNIVVSNNTTGGAFGKVSKATINGDEITGFAGAQSVGAVTIGAGDYERRIQNVAAGEVSATSTDGINGSQLYAVADTLSKNMSSYMHVNDGTSTQTVGNATTNYGYSGSKAGATGNLAIAGGMNAKASGQQSLSLGSYTKSEGDYSVVIGSSHDTSSWMSSRGQTFALGN